MIQAQATSSTSHRGAGWGFGETPPLVFSFNKFIGKMLYFSVKEGIIHSHRDLNSVSSSTYKTNLLGSMTSRLRSPGPRVRRHHVQLPQVVGRKNFLELETSGT
jgi:hypothetical protein